MPDLVYPLAPYVLEDFVNEANGTFRWLLLLDSFDPDPVNQHYVSDVAASEPTDGSYSRVDASGQVIWLTSNTDWGEYDADNPDFGSPSGDEIVAYCVLYYEVTNDNDSPIVAMWRINVTLDGGGTIIQIVALPGGSVLLHDEDSMLLVFGMAQHPYQLDLYYEPNDWPT